MHRQDAGCRMLPTGELWNSFQSKMASRVLPDPKVDDASSATHHGRYAYVRPTKRVLTESEKQERFQRMPERVRVSLRHLTRQSGHTISFIISHWDAGMTKLSSVPPYGVG